MKRKSKPPGYWRAKLEKPQPARIVTLTGAARKRFSANRMLIPAPIDVDREIRRIRRGGLATITDIRLRLAKAADVEHSCPLCTGIFLRIVAEAAEEDRRAGWSRVTPYWRVVRDNGLLIDKFPGAPERQAELLRGEGHEIAAGRGKLPCVEGFSRRSAQQASQPKVRVRE